MARESGTWTDIERDLRAAEDNAVKAKRRAKALRQRGKGMASDIRADREVAVASYLVNAYSAMESALERLIKVSEGDLPPEGRTYHVDLVDRSAAPVKGVRAAIIGHETVTELHQLRPFQHAMRRAYGAFDCARAEPNVDIAARAVRRFAREVTSFCRATKIKNVPSKWNGTAAKGDKAR
jgi:HepT-like protein